MARSDTAIAAHHHPWLAIENLNVALFHCVTDNSGAPIAHDLHVEFHWSDLFLFCDLVHRLELILGMCAATHDSDILRPSDVRQPTRNVDWILVMSTRNQHSNRRAPCVVRITIGSHVLTA